MSAPVASAWAESKRVPPLSDSPPPARLAAGAADPHLDVWDVFKQLVGDVFAALLDGLRGHLIVRIPVPVSRMRIGGTGRGVVDPGGGDDAHRFA